MGAIAPTIIDERIQNLHDLFEWRNEAAICDYLEENSDLTPFLPEAARIIRSIFGRDARIALKIDVCVDTIRGERELWIFVKVKYHVEPALDALRLLHPLFLT